MEDSNMGRLFHYTCILVIFCCWISESSQASVNPNCTAEISADTQCYTVVFTRSVFEGNDYLVTVDTSKTVFLLTLYSNTMHTQSLTGYKVELKTACGSPEKTEIHQLASEAIQQCKAEVTQCDSTQLVVSLTANTESIKTNVFHATVQLSLPRRNFQLFIQPMFDGDPNDVYKTESSNFKPLDKDKLESTGKSRNCTVTVPSRQVASQIDENGTVAMAVVFAVFLFLAAITPKIFGLVADKLMPRKNAVRDSQARSEHELQPTEKLGGGELSL